MSKYIDAEKLIAEIKRYKNKADNRLKIKGRTFSEEQKDSALQNLCGNLLHFIDSLQQEQLECIEKTARISPGILSNFGTSTYVLGVDLSQEEMAKMAPFGFNSGNIKIKIVCE